MFKTKRRWRRCQEFADLEIYTRPIRLSLKLVETAGRWALRWRIWYSTAEDSAAHQDAIDIVEYGKYEAMAVSPLAAGRLDLPDICLIYATPVQMILFINCLQ